MLQTNYHFSLDFTIALWLACAYTDPLGQSSVMAYRSR